MFEARLKEFLQQRAGLSPQDVPFVLTTFFVIKGCTFVSFVGLGVNLRPLSRLFSATARSGVRRLGREIEKTEGKKTGYGYGLRKIERMRGKYEEKKGMFRDGGTANVWERLGDRYRHYSKILTERLASNDTFVAVSKKLGMDPGPLGLGMAEGILCYKALFWAHGPLSLYIAVKICQFKGKSGEGGGKDGNESKNRRAEEDGVVKALHDIAEMSDMVGEEEEGAPVVPGEIAKT